MNTQYIDIHDKYLNCIP